MNAARLKAIRLARGMTLDDLSASMGGVVTKQALSKYELGSSVPTPRVLAALAGALGVKGMELLSAPRVNVETVAFRKQAAFPKGKQRDDHDVCHRCDDHPRARE